MATPSYGILNLGMSYNGQFSSGPALASGAGLQVGGSRNNGHRFDLGPHRAAGHHTQRMQGPVGDPRQQK